MNTTALNELINKTANSILDQWTAEAITKGLDVEDYIGDQLDEMEDSQPDVCQAVGTAHLRRVLA